MVSVGKRVEVLGYLSNEWGEIRWRRVVRFSLENEMREGR